MQIPEFKTATECQLFINENLSNARMERAKAAGYATLTVITAVAISAITYYAFAFLRLTHLLITSEFGPYYYYWMDDIFNAHQIFAPAGIVSGALSYFPIKWYAEGFFETAKENWNISNQFYSRVEMANAKMLNLI